MDTSKIYEQIMLVDSFNKIKYVRNQWYSSNEAKAENKQSVAVCDISGDDYSTYNFIIERCKEITYDMVLALIPALLSEYNLKYTIIPLNVHAANVIESVKDKSSALLSLHKHSKMLSFLVDEDDEKVLYCVKEFGICHSIPYDLKHELEKIYGFTSLKYISLVYEDAFEEVINHNDDSSDPSRGTDLYSIQWMFEHFFDKSEYMVFRKFADIFTQKVKDFLGFSIVRTLKPNSLYNFRKTVEKDLLSFELSSYSTEVSCEQLDVIKKHFLTEENYKLLLGSSDYAQSFMTAEWLYHSLKGAGSIDLTSISMGYYKAIEQFLYSYVSQHTFEKDHRHRNIYIMNSGLVELTDSSITDNRDIITLGALTGFFGYRHKDTGMVDARNRDLLYRDIIGDTYGIIIDYLQSISDVRNSYFHKSNLESWEIIEKDRIAAFKTFYLLLGSYQIGDKSAMGLAYENHDDFYKLCEYINYKAYHERNPLDIPLFSIDDNENTFVFCLADDFIEYSANGDPVYSGIYFRTINPNGPHTSFTRDSKPRIIKEGVFHIGVDDPSKMTITKPERVIFENGVFLG